ncbi:hypothetical protein DPV78_004467 [Talaromyces pinophilus]|nr:hypothetical protein DPV78_004467 [Talaromyces pinophilus]
MASITIIPYPNPNPCEKLGTGSVLHANTKPILSRLPVEYRFRPRILRTLHTAKDRASNASGRGFGRLASSVSKAS